jgi:hypothetical protein
VALGKIADLLRRAASFFLGETTMKLRLTNLVAGLVFLGSAFQASASPVDVTYTVTGSTGNWTYDFSVTNNLAGTNDLYTF